MTRRAHGHALGSHRRAAHITTQAFVLRALVRRDVDAGASAITDAMLFAAAEALADLAPDDDVAPNPLDRDVHAAVAARVRAAAE
jgi:malic enzyme